MPHLVTNIDVGLTTDHRLALTLHLSEGSAQTIVFSVGTARQLAWSLIDLCERLSVSGDSTAASDGCALSLSPPKED